MADYFLVTGYGPRSSADDGQRLLQWLRRLVASGELTRVHGARRPRQRWHERQEGRGGGWYREMEMKLWDFTAMGEQVRTKGWVMASREIATNQQGLTGDNTNWEAIRCLPESESEMQNWGRDAWVNRQERMMVTGFNRQYNLTLRDRLMRPQVPHIAHLHTVGAMRQQAISLISRACMELAMSVGSGQAMNPVPIAGELAGRANARRSGR